VDSTALAKASAKLTRLRQLFALPLDCQIAQDRIGKPVTIICESRSAFQTLGDRLVALAAAAACVDAPVLSIIDPDRRAPLTLKPKQILHYWGAVMPGLILPRGADGLLVITSKIELQRLVLLSPNTNVIEMATDTGLAAGANCHKTSGLTPEEWIGRKMSEDTPKGVPTWIPSEKVKFIDALTQHPDGVTGYEYPAYNYHGDPIHQCVRAQLCRLWDGRIVRIVESLNT